MAKSSGISKYAMWILMGLLILALGGFGAANLSGNIRTIGSVGNKSIQVDQYYRQLNQEIRAVEAQTRQQLPFAQAQAIGLDRAVLQRIVSNRALDNETELLGLSIGDQTLSEEIVQIPAFQGINGSFDREGYRFALQQGGISEAEFEITLREDSARALLQNAVIGGVKMPETYAQTLVNFAGEQRSFTWSVLDDSNLVDPVPTPTPEELRAFYDENADRFVLPASKSITYAWLTPDALLDEVEVAENALRRTYDERFDQFNRPERRLVERLVFADQDAADQAAAALETEDTTFNALVEQRGLQLSDVDMGDVGAAELEGAGDAVFAAETGEIVGPLPSNLGPALFRVNGLLPALETTFEQVRTALNEELAVAGAVRAVEARAQDLDDQLAGGVTLEELAENTEMTLGTIDWTPEISEDIAAYADFREAAASLAEGDFPKIQQLEDGGVFAMRLEAALEERPNPFEDARADVRAAWISHQKVAALTDQANAIISDLEGGASFADAGLDVTIEQDQTRNAFVDGTPQGFMTEVFDMEAGAVKLVDAEGSVLIVRLDEIAAASEEDQNTALLEQVSQQIDQTLAQDLFNIFNEVIVQQAGPQIDQRALNAVHVNFP